MYLITTSSRKRTALLLFLLISLLLAVGSGNSNGSGNIAQPPIKVGLLGPFSGPEGFIGQNSMKGVQLAADYINAHGGILGRQVQLITADTGGDVGEPGPACRQLINIC